MATQHASLIVIANSQLKIDPVCVRSRVTQDSNSFTPGATFSLFVNCQTQGEIDEFWEKLAEGGETLECGWLKDKYDISWQIVPTFVGELLKAKETDKTHRMLKALWQMQKLDIKRLKAAFDGRE